MQGYLYVQKRYVYKKRYSYQTCIGGSVIKKNHIKTLMTCSSCYHDNLPVALFSPFSHYIAFKTEYVKQQSIGNKTKKKHRASFQRYHTNSAKIKPFYNIFSSVPLGNCGFQYFLIESNLTRKTTFVICFWLITI